jgi:hypothetical protein
MSRRLKIVTLAVGVAMLAGIPGAFAGKGGNGVTGTIDLAEPLTASAVAWPAYGDSVGFQTAVEGKMANGSKLFITVVCRQDGNVVYQSSGSTDAVFNLTDQPALDWNGADADCMAYLRYKVTKGKNIEYTVLDTEGFHCY